MGRAWFSLDVVAVLAFVVIGRSTHHHGLSIGGVTSTAWPFALGLVVGWMVLVLSGRDVVAPSSGAVVACAVVAVGMVARVLAGQGTAVAFIVVALGFLGLCTVGTRALVAAWRRRGTARGGVSARP